MGGREPSKTLSLSLRLVAQGPTRASVEARLTLPWMSAGPTDPSSTSARRGRDEVQLPSWVDTPPDVAPEGGAELGSDRARHLGTQLFESLFGGEAGRLLDEGWRRVTGGRADGLRLELAFGPQGGARLAAIPWELLFWPRESFFLVQQRRLSLVRQLRVTSTAAPLPRTGPRHLLALGASPSDRVRLDLDRELDPIARAWQSMDGGFERLTTPTREALRRRLLERDVHVLHFMGHGTRHEASSEAADALIFEDDQGTSDVVDGNGLAQVLEGVGRSLRLVVLNACDSATPRGRHFGDVATALLRLGIPAVLAMQRPISDQGAIDFSESLYRRLAAGDSVETALGEARNTLARQHPGSDLWWTPVLWSPIPEDPSTGGVRAPFAAGHEPPATGPSASVSPYPDAASEQGYLDWLRQEMHTLGLSWHASPVVPTPAHRLLSLGWLARWRRRGARLFRHDPNDYGRNPALGDAELGVRAGFGRRKPIHDLAKELRRFSQIVVLGDPGSGKSVCLRQLAMDLASRRGRRRSVPIFVDMGAYDAHGPDGRPLPILDFLRLYLRRHPASAEAGNPHLRWLAEHLEQLLAEGRVTCIFDALDEMPREDYGPRYAALKTFMGAWVQLKNRFVYSCRSLDYDPVFQVGEVLIDPFDKKRIQDFLELHVPHRADALWRRIAEDESLLELVGNPFQLQALAYLNRGDGPLVIPRRRGELVRAFVTLRLELEAENKQQELLSWIDGGLPQVRHFLAELAFTLQQRRHGGTSVAVDTLIDLWECFPQWRRLLQVASRAQLLGKRYAPPPETLTDWSAPQRLEFSHHRLQEVFAAESLGRRLEDGLDLAPYLDDIWWHEPLVMALSGLPDAEQRIEGLLEPRPDAVDWLEQVDDVLQASPDEASA